MDKAAPDLGISSRFPTSPDRQSVQNYSPAIVAEDLPSSEATPVQGVERSIPLVVCAATSSTEPLPIHSLRSAILRI